MSSSQTAHDVAIAGAKLAPAVGVVAADATMRQLWGISFQDWVYILTAVYLAFQMIVIAPRVWHTIRGWFVK